MSRWGRLSPRRLHCPRPPQKRRGLPDQPLTFCQSHYCRMRGALATGRERAPTPRMSFVSPPVGRMKCLYRPFSSPSRWHHCRVLGHRSPRSLSVRRRLQHICWGGQKKQDCLQRHPLRDLQEPGCLRRSPTGAAVATERSDAALIARTAVVADEPDWFALSLLTAGALAVVWWRPGR